MPWKYFSNDLKEEIINYNATIFDILKNKCFTSIHLKIREDSIQGITPNNEDSILDNYIKQKKSTIDEKMRNKWIDNT
jgi:hypothetical protein